MRSNWETYRYLETEPTARKYLASKYAQFGIEHPERHAFHQSNRFLYTLKQARAYYHAANYSDLLIKPLLLFYGCINLLKALLISFDPSYPQNSKMLQHGATTRKIKRNPYVLLEDEVRPQKEGLFNVLSKKFRHPFVNDHYTVYQLFSYLPGLSSDFCKTVERQFWREVELTVDRDDLILTFPDVADGMLLYSPPTFLDVLNRFSPDNLKFQLASNHLVHHEKAHLKAIRFPRKLQQELSKHPLFSHRPNGIYFWNYSSEEHPLPDWATHYLLLYLLGMLCRYETAWWGELVLSHSYAEIYLVEQFLLLHELEFPHYVWTQMK